MMTDSIKVTLLGLGEIGKRLGTDPLDRFQTGGLWETKFKLRCDSTHTTEQQS